MFRLLFLAALVIASFFAGEARPHTGITGHGSSMYEYVSPTSGARTCYRDHWTDGWGNGPHYHRYATNYKKVRCSAFGTWIFIHEHVKQVPNTHPV